MAAIQQGAARVLPGKMEAALPCADAESGAQEQGEADEGGRLPAMLQTAAALLWIPQAALIAHAIGRIAAGDAAWQAAIAPACGLFVLGVLRAILDRKGETLAYDAARRRLGALRAQAAHAVAGRSPLDSERASSGLVASTLAEQAEQIVSYFARFRPLRFKVAVVPPVIAAVVFGLSWVAALVLVAAAPVIPLFMALIGWRAREASERQLVQMGSMNAFLLDRLRGLTTIRAFGAVDRTALRLRDNAERLRIATMAVLRIAFLSSAVLELFAALGVALVAVYVGFHYLGALGFGAWGDKLTLAQGLFILLLAPAFFEPLRELSSVWHDRASGQAGLAALQGLTTGGTRFVGAVNAAPVEDDDGALSVEVSELGFSHRVQADPVFSGFRLDVRPGEHVAILAPSGGGKSTLLALVAGLAPASTGSIRIGGEPLNDATAARLRMRMAWLGQPPHIFAGTLAGNVALGRPGVGADEVRQALALVDLASLAHKRGPAPIGENGVGVSGGEALRLALARMAAGPRPGLILADEPSAHLDRDTASEVIDNLLAIAAGSTLIVATHDPELAARMDRVVRLPGTEAEQ